MRSGVTRNPFYIVRQLLKDSVHASLTGNVESTPFMAVAKSLRNFIAIMGDQSPEAATLRKHGVLHSNIFSGTASDYNKVARMLAGDQQGWINRTLAFMDKAAMAADAATRTQVYQDIVAKGGTEMEAANAARELMNFNRHGSASSIQFFSRVIPFFNAAIQGLDVLYRSATGKMPA
ncbi:hypothetical protein JZU69_04535, partial [bacterium]|nr:hypothetical protein [bacterium]